jgi:iron complex outermembrane receptor protein
MRAEKAKFQSSRLPVIAAIYIAVGASAASAQQPGNAPPTAGAPAGATQPEAFQDIIVTARRREESQQTVPITIQVISSEALRQNEVRGLADLTKLAPGFRATPVGPDTNTGFTIRGLTRSPGGDGPPAVVTYFADVPLSQDATIVPTFDISNIQVLKGPQGTLFGRNALGGAVLITPQAPTFKVNGYLQGAFGNLNYRFLEGALNVPLVDDVLAVRVAGQIQKRDGYATNLVNGVRAGNIDRRSARASVLFTPSSNFRDTFIADYVKIDEVGHAQTLLGLLADPATGATPIGLASFFQCGTSVHCDINLQLARQKEIGVRNFYTNVPLSSKASLLGLINKTELDVGEVTFRNIAGYRSSKVSTRTSAFVDLVPEVLDTTSDQTIKQYSDEFQVLGKGLDGKLNWIAGAFYLEYDPTRGNITTVLAPGVWLPITEKRRNLAVFAQADYKLSSILEGLQLELGGRYNWDNEKLCSMPVQPGTEAHPTFDKSLCGPQAVVTYKGSAPTWTAGLNYQISRATLLYVTTRRGYREGGLNTPLFAAPEQAVFRPYQSVSAEKLTDVEVGIKSDWRMGGLRGRVDFSAYKQWLRGYQENVTVAGLVPGQFLPTNASLTVNSGNLAMSGFDGALTIIPVEGLTLAGSISYFHLDSSNAAIPASLNPTGVAAAPVTVPSPKWSGNLSLNYLLPAHPGGTDIRFNINYFYSGAITYEALTLPSYDTTDLRLEVANIAGTNLALAGFVQNVFDQKNIISAHIFETSFGIAEGAYAPPRTYGLEATYRF